MSLFDNQKEVFFATYECLGIEKCCQIEAETEEEARFIFRIKFDYYNRLVKVETAEQIAEAMAENLMVVIREQFEQAKIKYQLKHNL